MQNVYHEKELDLFQRDPTMPFPNKLISYFKRLYKATSRMKNDVEGRHLVMKTVRISDVSRVMTFHCSMHDGCKVAKIDADQANIVAIHNWRN